MKFLLCILMMILCELLFDCLVVYFIVVKLEFVIWYMFLLIIMFIFDMLMLKWFLLRVIFVLEFFLRGDIKVRDGVVEDENVKEYDFLI